MSSVCCHWNTLCLCPCALEGGGDELSKISPAGGYRKRHHRWKEWRCVILPFWLISTSPKFLFRRGLSYGCNYQYISRWLEGNVGRCGREGRSVTGEGEIRRGLIQGTTYSIPRETKSYLIGHYVFDFPVLMNVVLYHNRGTPVIHIQLMHFCSDHYMLLIQD